MSQLQQERDLFRRIRDRHDALCRLHQEQADDLERYALLSGAETLPVGVVVGEPEEELVPMVELRSFNLTGEDMSPAALSAMCRRAGVAVGPGKRTLTRGELVRIANALRDVKQTAQRRGLRRAILSVLGVRGGFGGELRLEADTKK